MGLRMGRPEAAPLGLVKFGENWG